VSYTDPYVPGLQHGTLALCSVPEDSAADGVDCAVICTNHSVFDYAAIAARYPLVVDTRNALKGVSGVHVFRL
jgi:UDP-N-acetyl-D-mannosaminuronate dehydrogenase